MSLLAPRSCGFEPDFLSCLDARTLGKGFRACPCAIAGAPASSTSFVERGFSIITESSEEALECVYAFGCLSELLILYLASLIFFKYF